MKTSQNIVKTILLYAGIMFWQVAALALMDSYLRDRPLAETFPYWFHAFKAGFINIFSFIVEKL